MSINVIIKTKNTIKENDSTTSLIERFSIQHDEQASKTYTIKLCCDSLKQDYDEINTTVDVGECIDVPLTLTLNDFVVKAHIEYEIQILDQEEVVFNQKFNCILAKSDLESYFNEEGLQPLFDQIMISDDSLVMLKQIYELILSLSLNKIISDIIQYPKQMIESKQATLLDCAILFAAILNHYQLTSQIVKTNEDILLFVNQYTLNMDDVFKHKTFDDAIKVISSDQNEALIITQVEDEKLSLSIEYNEYVNFSMVHNRIRFLKRLTIENKLDTTLENLMIKIYCDEEYLKPFEMQVKTLKGNKKYELRDLEINVNFNKLYELSARVITNLNIEIIDEHNQVLAKKTKELIFLGKDEWNGMPHLLCSFITPENVKVKELITLAHEEYKQLYDGDASWSAYQSNDKNIVLKQIQAIYQALWKQQITYKVTSSTDMLSVQRIAIPNEVLSDKMGACLDLSITFASALEAIGLNPLIVLISGHAFVGCWLINDLYSEMICYDEDTLQKYCASGIDDMIFLETTLVCQETLVPFKEAIAKGKSKLSQDFSCALDVRRTRLSGVMPIPEKQEDLNLINLKRDERIHDDIVEVENDHQVETTKSEYTKLQVWERKLLDLSLKNSLLNLRISNSLVQLMVNDVAALEDAFAKGNEFVLLGKPDEVKCDSKHINLLDEVVNKTLIELLNNENQNKKIRMFVSEKDGKQALLNLYRKSKNSIEENGTNTLYMSLGLLKWYESEVSNMPRYAPLVLIPVELVRKSATLGYTLRARDEDAIVNITLLEMLRQNFKIDMMGLDPLPMDDNGIDIKKVFKIVRNAVLKKEKWNVYEACCLGLFSFKQFVMWSDLKHRSNELKQNKVVASLMEGKRLWEVQEDFNAINYDEDYLPSDLAIPISADSAQLKALIASSKGESFVLHGPPGTGKSQTITNMIANALYQNKSVLFIAEKSAALSVVQKRLTKIGLGPFCLELHSNQSRKSHVLSQFEKTLELGKLAHPQEFANKASELLKLRQALNKQMEELHKVNSLGYSIYDAMSELENYIHYPSVNMIKANNLHQYNKDKVSQDLSLLEEYITSAKQIDACNHPLKNINLYNYNVMMKDELVKWINEYDLNYNQMIQHSTFNELKNLSATKALYDKLLAVFTLINKQTIDLNICNETLIKTNYDTIKQLIKTHSELNKTKKQLEKVFEDVDLLNIDSLYQQWKKANESWVIGKALAQNKVVKQLKVYAQDPSLISNNNAFDLMKQVKAYQKQSQEFKQKLTTYDMIEVYFKQNKLNELEKQLTLAKQIFDLLQDFEAKETVLQLINQYVNDSSFKSYLQSFMNVMDIAQMMSNSYVYVNCTDDYLYDLQMHYQLIKQNLKLAREYSIYCSKRQALLKRDFLELIYAYEEGYLKLEEMKGAYLKNFYEVLCLCMIDESDTTRTFSIEAKNQKLKDYQQVLNDYQELTKQELVARLSSRIPQGSGATSSQIGILKRAIKSHGRGMSVRKLFDSIPLLIQQLTPCMLMSPLSVAQYIDPSFEQFDYVIFDEASQVPTAYAIGAIARGKNCIIVGDPKQLPPTSFFMSQNVDEDHMDVEDLESILDDCLSISMPQMYLSWHYRSQHESLIAFSNKEFYENRLMTFPSANDQQTKVQFVKVEGCYEKGNKRTNSAEAKAIVEEIRRRVFDDKLCQDSIGVVTFNINQQNLIDDLLLQEFMNDKVFEEKVNALYEPLFIKNLENVQGDERDVILFSICYGPDAKGNVSMNFGPLNKEGGSRRLNVAVSRSRKEMVIFSTLLPHQIDLSRTTSKGVEDLKGFLEFAYSGNLNSNNFLEVSMHDQMVEHIAKDLRNLGYQVHTFVGGSDFKVDLAIVDKDQSDQYALGIMVDGKQYVKQDTAKDRNLAHISVLKNLGWKIYQLWTMQWWYHRDQVLADIDELMMHKDDLDDEANEVKKNDEFVYVKEEVIDKSQVYTTCSIKDSLIQFDEMSMRQIQKQLIPDLLSIIDTEAPISLDALIARIKPSYHITRINENNQSLIYNELLGIKSIEMVEDPYSHKIMIWKKEQRANYDTYRISEIKRDLDDIAYEELVNAAISIVEKEFSIPQSEFAKVFIKLFGYKVCNEKMRDKVNKLVNAMVDDGYLIIQDQYIMVRN